MTLSRLHLAMVRGHSDNIKYSEWRVLSKQDEVDILGSNGISIRKRQIDTSFSGAGLVFSDSVI